MLTIALSHLLRRGVRLETHEAVALAREILAHPCGVPTPENIQLGSDGSASSISANGTPSVASVGALLLTLLPEGTPNVPAPLRYAIARALDAVEAPPFASLADFSAALERFEHGASREVLRALLQRVVRSPPSIAPASAAAPIPVIPAVAASTPVPQRPTVSPPRLTVVHRQAAGSANESSEQVAAAPTTFTRFGANRGQSSRVHSWWSLGAAATVIASFAVGFAAAGGITGHRAAENTPGSAHVSSGFSAAASAGSAANAGDVEPQQEFVRLPSAAVNRELLTNPASVRGDAAADQPKTIEGGGEQVRAIEAIRTTNADAFSPAFGSDGTAIFFHTGRDRDARSAIEVATADGQAVGDPGVRTIIDDGWHNYHAQPSPNGRLVAFDSDRDGQRGIYVADRDGSHVRRVTGAGYAAVPTWSPNSEWLAYIRAEARNPSVWNLWVQPVAGSRARRVTNYRYGQTWAASWFPDNRRIAYSHEDVLIVMDLQTGNSTRYRTPVKGQLVRTPAVSPDGTTVIFQVFRDGAWLLNLTDGSMKRVLADPTAEEFAWSPDGSRVAFHSRRARHWGIYILSGRQLTATG